MKGNIAIGLFVVIVQWLYFLEVAGQDKACKEATSKLMKVQLKFISDCTTQLKFKDAADKKKRGSCLMKCAMTKAGILNDQGLPDDAAAEAFLQKNFPESVWEKAKKLLMECEKQRDLLDVNDPLCKSYDAMTQCGMKAFSKFCT